MQLRRAEETADKLTAQMDTLNKQTEKLTIQNDAQIKNSIITFKPDSHFDKRVQKSCEIHMGIILTHHRPFNLSRRATLFRLAQT